MGRIIICTNEDGMEVRFTNTFTPWLLEDCDGIYSVTNTVSTSENTMTDGATYQGSTTQMRNIILTLRDHPKSNHQENRSLLYNVFKPKSAGTLNYLENVNTERRSIDYYVESIDIDAVNRARRATISLICPDPFFVAPNDITVTMAGWEPQFEWDHEFLEDGEEFETRVEEKLKFIDNTSAADNIGMQIRIEAAGTVTNPSIYHVEQGEQITVGTSGKPLTLINGDILEITTGTNNKHVYLTHEGEKQEINEYLSENSEFIQIQKGTNTIGYSAESGETYMTVEISYRYRYLGV
jgi:phage-related protein